MKKEKNTTYQPFSNKLHKIFLTNSSRPRKWLIFLFFFYVLYCLGSWILLPRLLHQPLTNVLLQDLQSRGSFERISYNPFSLTFSIHELSITYPDEDDIFLSAKEISLSPGVLRLFRLTPALGHVHILDPVLNLSLSKDGELSPLRFASLQHNAETNSEEQPENALTKTEPIFPFVISDLSIANGTINFDDQKHNTKILVEDLNIRVPFASTLQSDKLHKVRPTLSATVNGQALELEGQITPFDDQIRAEFTLQTRQFPISTLQPYLSPHTSLQIAKGEASTELLMYFTNWQSQIDMGFSGHLELQDLSLITESKQEVLSLDYASIELEHMLMNLEELTISELVLKAPKLKVTQEKGNTLNWQGYFKIPSPAKASTSEKKAEPDQALVQAKTPLAEKDNAQGTQTKNTNSAKPVASNLPNIHLKKLWLTDGEIFWQDNAGVKTHGFKLNPINIDITNFHTQGNSQAEFILTLGNYTITQVIAKPKLDAENEDSPEQAQSEANAQGEAQAQTQEASQTQGEAKTPEAVKNQATVNEHNFINLQRRVKPSLIKSAFGGAVLLGRVQAETFNLEALASISSLPTSIFAPYLEAAGVGISSGSLQADAEFTLLDPTTKLSLAMQKGKLSLQDFQGSFTSPSKEQVEVKTTSLTLDKFDFSTEKLSLGQIALERPAIKLTLPAKRSEEKIEQKVSLTEGKNANGKQEPKADFIVDVQKFLIKNGSVFIVNQEAPERPLELSEVAWEVSNFSTLPKAALQAKGSAIWNKTGSTTTTGSGTLNPLNIVLSSEFKAIPLASLAPWLKQFSSAQIVSGTLDGDLTTNIADAGIAVKASLSPEQEKRAKAAREKYSRNRKVYTQESVASKLGIGFALAGKASLKNLLIKDQGQDMIGLQSARLFGLSINTAASTYDIGRISLDEPRLNLTIFPDGTNSFSRALFLTGQATQTTKPVNSQTDQQLAETASASKNEAKTTQKTPKTEATPAIPTEPRLVDIYRLSLNSMKIKNGQVRISDQSLATPALITIADLGLELENLSSQADSPAKFTITGLLEGANLSIFGQGNPLRVPLQGDIDLTLHDMDMRPISPYAEKFLGHPVEKGLIYLRSNLDTNGLNITGKIRIKTYNLTLGKKVDTPNAPNQPIKLGLSLLADRDGTIALTIPIDGKLSDPDFRTGAIIGKGFRNLISKVITSPFSLLAAIASGGKEAPLQFVPFEAGASTVPSASLETIKQVIKLLESRPKINLVLQGVVDQGERDFLATAFVKQGVQNEKWNKLSKKERLETRPADISVNQGENPEEFQALLLDFYANQNLDTKANIKKLRKAPLEQVLQAIKEKIDTNDKALEILAQSRAEAVRQEFLSLAPQLETRIKIAPAPSFRQSKEGQELQSRVEFGIAE